MGMAKEKFDEMRGYIDKLTDIQHVRLSELQEHSMMVSKKSIYILLFTVIFGLVVSIILFIFMIRTVKYPIIKSTDLMVRLSGGYLKERLNITQHDEVGKLSEYINITADNLAGFIDALSQVGNGDLTISFDAKSNDDQISPVAQKMVTSLYEIVKNGLQSAEKVRESAGQVSDSSQSLSQGASEQAASLEQITSSMTQIGSQTHTNSENATQANQLAIDARNAAEKGNQQMEEMLHAMSQINASSHQIAKIIKTIDDIAFQTNLLALNAAVEAARAGKHGKGFAVVAQEVRNLAARSAKAAQETEELIDGSVKKVDLGTQTLNRTAQALQEIVTRITKTADLVGEIAAASNEQAQGILQINQGLNQIEQVTQQNTANAEHTAAAATQLLGHAAQLNQMLAQFRINKSDIAHEIHSNMQSINISDEFECQPKSTVEKHHFRSQIQQHALLSSVSKAASPKKELPVQKAIPAKRPEQLIALDDNEFGKY
ncbi:MAG: methyl-accepting chemotaxis protein [Desulfobacterales bacterium]|nr:methyl-accepting chemotaxis protein [Desulfobacterales bacterium]